MELTVCQYCAFADSIKEPILQMHEAIILVVPRVYKQPFPGSVGHDVRRTFRGKPHGIVPPFWVEPSSPEVRVSCTDWWHSDAINRCSQHESVALRRENACIGMGTKISVPLTQLWAWKQVITFLLGLEMHSLEALPTFGLQAFLWSLPKVINERKSDPFKRILLAISENVQSKWRLLPFLLKPTDCLRSVAH